MHAIEEAKGCMQKGKDFNRLQSKGDTIFRGEIIFGEKPFLGRSPFWGEAIFGEKPFSGRSHSGEKPFWGEAIKKSNVPVTPFLSPLCTGHTTVLR